MKLISLFAITVSVQANGNQASKREQMKFNIQTSKNGLFKYSEMEDVEMIRSKRGVFLLYFEIIRGNIMLRLFGNETTWVEPRQVSLLCQLAGHILSQKRRSSIAQKQNLNLNLELRILQRRPRN